jgi:hypothetical protein
VAKSIEAYPLAWPTGWKRTKLRRDSNFKMTTEKAHKELINEIGRMGGEQLIISTGVPLRQDGRMRMDREPVDPGVAVYFQREGKGVVFACDTYDSVGENLRAIGVTIGSLRAIERHGASELLERAFSGFKQLAAENEGESWWKTLQLPADASVVDIESAYRRLAKFAHPDQPGGSNVGMAALNAAKAQGLSVARQKAGQP